MTRLALLLSLLVTGIAAVQKLHLTRDEDFIRKQEFVYQLLWKPDDLSKRFADLVERAENLGVEDLRDLPINQTAVEEFIARYESNDLLPKGLSATAFNPDHRAEIANVFDVLFSAKDFETFALLSLYTNNVQNQILWFFEFVIAVMQRDDTRRARFPNFHEALPQYAFNNDVLDRLDEIQSRNCSRGVRKNVIKAEYSVIVSRPSNDPEARLSYFTEDIGLGNFYFFLATADMPFWLNSEIYDLPSYRRGERYFNDHKQLLARYYLERLSNGLGGVENIDYNRNILTGYYPEMRDYNGIPFPIRPFNTPVRADKYEHVQLAEAYEERLTDAADQGKLLTKNGELTDSNPVKFFNALMNAIQGNGDSVNAAYYGSLDVISRHILGFSPEPTSKFDVIISALENLNADVRDPGFYRMYKKIVDLGLRYKSNLQPYKQEELNFPGVTVEDVKVDKITTYFDKFDSLVGQQDCDVKSEKVPTVVRQKRLNHKNFKIHLKVKSNSNAKAVVRLFLGPKFNANGGALNIDEIQHGFFQLDQFIVKLKEGENKIVRKDSEFAYQVPDSPRSDILYNIIERSANDENPFPYYEQPYGYPRRLMIPRGKTQGLTLRIFAIVTPLKIYTEIDTLIAGKEFNDGRALGYPFDRPVQLRKFKQANIKFQDVVIYHERK